jgi:hypothetical protein
MKLLRLAAKILASSAVVYAAVMFLLFVGPPATTVHADIYAHLVGAAGLLEPPPGGGAPVRTGHVLVNGRNFEYTIGHSGLSLKDVLDHYQHQFDMVGARKGQLLSRATRFEGNGAGVVVGMRFGPIDHPFDIADRLRTFAATSRVNDLARIHIISAYAQHGTVFLDFTPSDEVRLTDLVPQGTDDAPGEDLDGVQRPDGLQRMMTIEHGEGAARSRSTIYRTSDGEAAVVAFREALSRAMWTPDPSFETPNVAHYADGHRDCFVGGSGRGANAAVVLVCRLLPNRGQLK